MIQNIPGQVYIQILNVSDKEITLEIDLVVATVSTVEEASVFNLTKDNELDFIPNESVNINNENSNEEYKPPPIDFDLSKSVLTTEQKELFQKFLAEHRGVFATTLKELGKTNVFEHKIEMTNDTPFQSRPYRTTPTAKRNRQTSGRNVGA